MFWKLSAPSTNRGRHLATSLATNAVAAAGSPRLASRPSKRALAPLRQGDLDSLCGVYAIVNAVRKSAHGHGLRRNEWKELFNLLIDAQEESGTAVESVTAGIFSKPLWKLARRAVTYCRSRSIPMAVSRPIGREHWAGLDLPSWLAIQAARPATAVVMGLVLPWDHWTVLHSVGRRYVSFYDSSDCRRLALSRFAGTGNDGAITNPRSLMVFEVDELAFDTDD